MEKALAYESGQVDWERFLSSTPSRRVEVQTYNAGSCRAVRGERGEEGKDEARTARGAAA